MASTANPQTDSDRRAEYFLKPEQVDAMRSAIVEESPNYLSMRNEAIIALLYDTGLRNGELVDVDVDLVDLEDGNLRLPTEIQKDYPNEGSPPPVTMELAEETVRLLRQYLNTRWRDSPALFPSRQADRATTETVRNVVSLAAESAMVRPYSMGGRGESSDVSPHLLRHSVAWRMVRREDKTIYDVKNRLRHSSVSTTEDIYSHFEVV